MWVEANVKETDLTYVKAGDPVEMASTPIPARSGTGSRRLAPSTGAEFSILPAQNASGNWVKVVQRITVTIKVDHLANGPMLRSGMSVVVESTRAISASSPILDERPGGGAGRSTRGNARTDGAAAPAHRKIITLCTIIATLMQALDSTIANVALPYMQGSLRRRAIRSPGC